MRNHFIYIALMLLAIMFSCNNDEIAEHEQKEPEVFVKVCGINKSNSNEINEQGAKLYIYYDFSSLQLLKATYAGQGELVYEGSVIRPSQIYETDKYGSCTIIPQYSDKSLLILVESRYNDGRLSHEYYDRLKESASIKFLFYY